MAALEPLRGQFGAAGREIPEGPVDISEGRVVFCDGNTGELLV
jgi:hypothetical protein